MYAPILSFEEQMTTASMKRADPAKKIITIVKAYPSYPATLKGSGFGGAGGGAGQLSSQSTQLQAGVES